MASKMNKTRSRTTLKQLKEQCGVSRRQGNGPHRPTLLGLHVWLRPPDKKRWSPQRTKVDIQQCGNEDQGIYPQGEEEEDPWQQEEDRGGQSTGSADGLREDGLSAQRLGFMRPSCVKQ